jgi:hypothetical protein
MNQQDQQLVEMIARQVIEQLTQSGLISNGPNGPGSSAASIAQSITATAVGQIPQADIRPPIGTCTGDYSQYPELTGREIGAAPPIQSAVASPQASATTQASCVALTGIVTANQLQAAMDFAADGVAQLAPEARLTPLANDLARQYPERVSRVSASQTPGDASAAQWMWWTDGHCPVIQQLVGQYQDRLISVGGGYGNASVSGLIRELSGAISHKRTAGGLLFVKNAARVMCMANRCRSIRAVTGTCPQAVEQGISEIGMNVLVIEYPYQSPQNVYTMVERFLQQRPQVPAMVERELADLHRCD